jgi:hypothetical protein
MNANQYCSDSIRIQNLSMKLISELWPDNYIFDNEIENINH